MQTPIRALFSPALAVLLLVACQAPAPRPIVATPSVLATVEAVDLQAEYHALAQAGGNAYAIDPAASAVTIYAFRGGAAAKAGHNHVLTATKFEGYVHLPSDTPAQARFDLRVRLDELVVDDPAARERTGGNFAGTRSESDIEGTKRNMLGPRGLEADQFPFVQIRSVAVAGDWPVLVADVAVTLHGVTRQQPVMLRAEHSPTALNVSGTLVLRQTEFGVTPYSLFGGVLAVQDPVAITFNLNGKPF